MNKISVVIPAYNSEEYIKDCLDSVLSQKRAVFEIVVINDGSTDKTEDIVLAFQKKYLNIKYYKIPNGGQSSARNYGIAQAQGEYILFVDSDDILSDGALDVLSAKLDTNYVDIIFFNGKSFYDDDSLKDDHVFNYKRSKLLYNRTMDIREFSKFTIQTGGFIAQPCLFLFKKELLQGYGFYPGIIQEDNLFTAQLMLMSIGQCLVISDDLYNRRVRHESTITSAKNIRNVKGYTICATELSKIKNNNSLTNKLIERLCFVWFKEALAINSEFNLGAEKYVITEIKKSNVSLISKIILTNKILLVSVLKIKRLIKYLKR
ncbi:glycosyltransferase family 2 protein [Pluralibacter gergoviae]